MENSKPLSILMEDRDCQKKPALKPNPQCPMNGTHCLAVFNQANDTIAFLRDEVEMLDKACRVPKGMVLVNERKVELLKVWYSLFLTLMEGNLSKDDLSNKLHGLCQQIKRESTAL